MMIFRDYVVVANNDLHSFQLELDRWAKKGYMLFQPVYFPASGQPHKYIAVMEIARAGEE